MLNVWKKNNDYKSKSPINENVEISVYKEINETPLNDFKLFTLSSICLSV